jgi:drug/metabolite transporter (DMT)-like permease
VLAAGFWALSGTLSKSLFNQGMTPFQLVQLRTTIAAGVLLCWFMITMRGLPAMHRKDIRHFMLLGMILAVSQVTYLYAISRIQVASAILLQYQAPVFIALHAVLFAHRRLSAFTAASIIAALAGCYLVAGAYNQDLMTLNTAGIIAGLLSAIAFGLYSIMSDTLMKQYRPLTVVFYALLFAAVFWNILQVPFSAFAVGYGTPVWLKIIFIGIFGTVVPFFFFNQGILKIGPTHTSVAATMEPVFAGVLSYAILGETLEVPQFIGAGLVIAAIVLLQSTKDRG